MRSLLALLISIPAGIIAGVRPNSLIDRLLSGFATMGLAVPPFVLAIVLVAIFSVWLNVLPAQGFVAFSEDPAKNLTLVLLPATALAIVAAAPIIRFLRASILETIVSPYIRTAEGKGLRWRQIVLRHALPNALVPTVTVVGLIVGYMLGGVVVIEYVFGWQGLGQPRRGRRPEAGLCRAAGRGAPHRSGLHPREPGRGHPVRRDRPSPPDRRTENLTWPNSATRVCRVAPLRLP